MRNFTNNIILLFLELTMTPTNTSLVKYDNPKLVSRSTDAKAQRKQKSPQQSPAPGVPGIKIVTL